MEHAVDLRGTATALRGLLDAPAHGGGYFPINEETETDEDARIVAFSAGPL